MIREGRACLLQGDARETGGAIDNNLIPDMQDVCELFCNGLRAVTKAAHASRLFEQIRLLFGAKFGYNARNFAVHQRLVA